MKFRVTIEETLAKAVEVEANTQRLCQKSVFGPAYHKLGSYQVSI